MMLILWMKLLVKTVRRLLEWYGFDVTQLRSNHVEQHRNLLAGYMGVALLA